MAGSGAGDGERAPRRLGLRRGEPAAAELVNEDLRECEDLACGGFMFDNGVEGSGVFDAEKFAENAPGSFISDAEVMTEPASEVVDPLRAMRGLGMWKEGGRDERMSIEW